MRLLRSIIIGAIVSAGAFGVVAMGNYHDSVNAADCSSNAVVKCGVTNITGLRQAYARNVGNTQALYRYFGISSTMINQAKYASGSVTKDGKIVVNGKTVATGGMSAGREMYAGSTKITVNGSTFYTRPAGSLFPVASEPAIVFYNADGSVSHAVIISCGNPVKATPVQPPKPPTPTYAYKCESLAPTKLSRTEYQFDTKASVSGGAEIVSYSYNYGDGTPAVNAPATTKHTFAKPGTYKVTVQVKVKTGATYQTVSCSTTITVAEEMCPIPGKTEYPKDSDKCFADKPSVTVTKLVSGKESAVVNVNAEYTYTILVKNTGNISLTNAVVSDAQPTGVIFTKASSGTITNGTWSEMVTLVPGASKSITLTAKLTRQTNQAVINKACVDATEIKTSPDACDMATVTSPEDKEIVVCVVATKTEKTIKESEFVEGKMVKGTNAPECKPAVPVVVEETPKTPEPTPVPESPKPEPVVEAPVAPVSTTPAPQPEPTPAPQPEQTVTELPKTGTIDVLGGTLGLGSLAGAGYYYFDSRRKLANIFKNL